MSPLAGAGTTTPLVLIFAACDLSLSLSLSDFNNYQRGHQNALESVSQFLAAVRDVSTRALAHVFASDGAVCLGAVCCAHVGWCVVLDSPSSLACVSRYAGPCCVPVLCSVPCSVPCCVCSCRHAHTRVCQVRKVGTGVALRALVLTRA